MLQHENKIMNIYVLSPFIGQHANFWCSTEFDEGRAYETLLGLNNGKIGRDKGNKGCGFSVRYIKD
jgi:hypothetical protein